MRLALYAAVALVALASCTSPQTGPQTSAQTTAPTSIAATNPVKPSAQWRLSGRAMVSAADKRAVEAALNAMKQGGSAVDAAIAAHTVLGLVEPQSSGLGGGGYIFPRWILAEFPGATRIDVAELDPAVKNRIGHRGQALAALAKMLGARGR